MSCPYKLRVCSDIDSAIMSPTQTFIKNSNLSIAGYEVGGFSQKIERKAANLGGFPLVRNQDQQRSQQH
ncbi:hypothetical protein ATN88_04480 [Enterovibrio coralii]|uniref:Uncharacterized protein n=1 Tax=Enterovibrio coralii TaxID=294935 RepID=A0A135ICD5_9GAMM|nr:hypothetical protein ATN88_04480 [Enterovibrio coralii]